MRKKRYIIINRSSLISETPNIINLLLKFLVEEYGYNKVRKFIKRSKSEHLFKSVNEKRWEI